MNFFNHLKNMIKIKRLIILMALFVLMPLSHALTIEDVQKRLATPIVKADFEQMRQISGMSKPLLSKGQIIISEEKGLFWHQTAPFTLIMLFTDTVMKQKTGDQPVETITAEKNPQLFQFNHLLSSLFKADKVLLEKNFTVTFTDRSNEAWEIQLTPKTAPLNRVFKSIHLTGEAYLNTIELNDLQNDQTLLRFFDHKTDALTPKELKNFAF